MTLRMPRGSGELRLSWAWAGPAGEADGEAEEEGGLEEVLELWPGARLAAEGASVVLASAALAEGSQARALARAAAAWAATQADVTVAVVDASSVDGQVLATEVWPQLPGAKRVAVLLTPPLSAGAAASFSTALALQPVLAGLEPSHVAVVGERDWARVGKTLAPHLAGALAQRVQAEPGSVSSPLEFPAGALADAAALLRHLHEAVEASRPYIHALSGAGALEMDVREALAGAKESLEQLEAATTDADSAYLSAYLSTYLSADAALPTDAPHPAEAEAPTAGAHARRRLVPVGRAAAALAQAVAEHLATLWHVGDAPDGESLVALDLAI